MAPPTPAVPALITLRRVLTLALIGLLAAAAGGRAEGIVTEATVTEATVAKATVTKKQAAESMLIVVPVPVDARPSPQQVAPPNDIALDGPFGAGRTIADTPRSTTPITAALAKQAAITELRDIQRLVPNSYGANTFGAASLPSFRGQLGEIFQDGLRRQGGNNGLGLPLSLNGVERIDAVKGPPPVMFGSTQRVGGFVNLIPKRPDLHRELGEVSVQAGRWDRYREQLDYSTPIEPGRSGVRFSLENRDEDSFYDFASYQSQNLFAAYRLAPDGDSILDLNVEYFNVDFTDNAGFNRPTQDLIDHGRYITGQGVQANGSTVPAAGSVVSPTGSVRLPRHRVLTDPGDQNNSETWIANLRYEAVLAPGLKWINRAIYQHLEREEIARNSFVEIIDGADTIENRSEFIANYSLPLLGLTTAQESIFGIDLRYHDIKGFSQFTTEADNPIDLGGPIANRRITLTAAQQARLVQLRSGVFVSPGAQYDRNGDGLGDFNLSDTTDSRTHQVGVFAQQDVRFTPRWSLLLGLRGDWYDVSANDPASPPGVRRASDSIGEFLSGANASLSFKPVPEVTAYFAFSRSDSTANSLGGGFVLGAGNVIDVHNFATESELHELGIKYASVDGRRYADIVAFDQTRNQRNRDGSNSGIRSRGVESQLSYRPDDHWFAHLAASVQDAHFDNAAGFQDSRSVLDAFDNSRPDLVAGSGVGSPSFTAFSASQRRRPGLPQTQMSGLVSYAAYNGFEGGLSAVYTDAFPLDYLATVKIRAQVTVNAFVAYEWQPWNTSLRLDVFNLTNEDNFSPVFDGGYFGSTLVFPEPPINAMLTLRHRFAL